MTGSIARKNTSGLVAIDERCESLLQRALSLALEEDLGGGDITTQSTVPADLQVKAAVWFKQAGVIAGLPIFKSVMDKVDPSIQIEFVHQDGQWVNPPLVVARLQGPARSILTAERVALNFLQRLSGIATTTRKLVELANPAHIAILDTRKTTPGLRTLERYAVRVAGGVNHRFGLFDAILIKDNHIRLAGGIKTAIQRARLNQAGKRLEVEAATLEEVQSALAEKVDVILLDNMTPNQVRQAVSLIASQCLVEVSGGVTLDNLSDYLIDGVQAISVGAITHSSPSIDISLEIEA